MIGFHVTTEAPGAYRNGQRIVKCESEPGDAHPTGALGSVIGSVGPEDFQGRTKVYGYFVEWDDMPGVAVGTVSFKITAYAERAP